MTGPDLADRSRRGIAVSVSAVIGSALFEFIVNVVANLVHLDVAWLRHEWVLVVSVILSVLGTTGAVWYLYQWRRAEGISPASGAAADSAEPERSFPSPADLVGRHAAACEAAARQARRHGVVVVTGPSGIGASAVALGAAWKLAPSPDRQRYVDLRGGVDAPESQHRARIRVLSVLGIRAGEARDPGEAAKAMAGQLAGTGTVLVLDNAERADQISWTADRVPGAYVIAACGDVAARGLPPGMATVQVQPLDRTAALDLLARQGDEDSAASWPDRHLGAPGWPAPRGQLAARARRTLAGWWSGSRHGAAAGARNTVRARIDAEPGAASELARSYLWNPRVVIEMGRWLAANPSVSLTALVEDLRGAPPDSELAVIVRKQLSGTSPGARRLLALLAATPVAELPVAAIAALADTGQDRARELLGELRRRSLVEWSRPSRCRITPQARQVARDPGDSAGRKAVARSHARLAAYYARLAATWGDAMEHGDSVPAAQEWLRSEDVALLQLLSASAPPRRAGASLWLIAGALDTWFAREQRLEDRRTAAEAMRDAADYLRARTPGAIAWLRLAAAARDRGDFAAAAESLDQAQRLAGRNRSLRLQVRTAWTAHHMTAGDLHAARDCLRDCMEARPRRDVRGRVTDLINRAALDLHDDASGAALTALSQALPLAEAAADVTGQAHALELFGIAEARSGRSQHAGRAWERALTLYEQAGDAAGQARCLQHQGTAAVVAGGALAAEASRLLSRSLTLRGSQRTGLGVALAHLYAAAAQELSPASRQAHRAAGLAALAPLALHGSEPPTVSRARTQLAGIASDHPARR